jgi:DNA-binding NarL/FixJ family response regulator
MAAGCCKVLLVGHRPHVRTQVRLAIESRTDLVVVGEAANYLGAVAIAAIETPDFIVVDLAEDDECAIDHIPDLVRATNNVLVLSDICDGALLDRARRLGATDLVPREAVVGAITSRLDGAGRILTPPTAREQAVIELACKGLNDEEIAGQLMTSDAAVSEDLDSILRKKKVRARFELQIYSLYKDLASRE